MLLGIFSGFIFRKWKFKFINAVILTLIWLLLFLLGVEVGLNEQVVSQFPKLGLEAFLLACFATLGSVLGAKILMPPSSDKEKN